MHGRIAKYYLSDVSTIFDKEVIYACDVGRQLTLTKKTTVEVLARSGHANPTDIRDKAFNRSATLFRPYGCGRGLFASIAPMATWKISILVNIHELVARLSARERC